MALPGSVSRWIAAIKSRDTSAAQPLWRRYYRHLLALARRMLRAARRPAADEEDVVQNAFHSFFKAIHQGRFPDLTDRHGLERLLLVITTNKALKQLQHERRHKRGGRASFADARPADPQADAGAALLRAVAAGPPPDCAAQMADDWQHLLELLDDETLRQVARWKMEGNTNAEIAARLSCSRRTVARKIDAIRTLWTKELAGQTRVRESLAVARTGTSSRVATS